MPSYKEIEEAIMKDLINKKEKFQTNYIFKHNSFKFKK